MNIILVNGNNKNIEDYFEFNRIPYYTRKLWHAEPDGSGHYICDPDLVSSSGTLLVINAEVFCKMWAWSTSRARLLEFLNNDNKVWIFADTDSLLSICSRPYLDYVLEIDPMIGPGAVKIFLDGPYSDRHPLTSLRNVRLVVVPYNIFLRMPRILNSVCDKFQCTRDFMLTMNKIPDRPHRQILYNRLQAIPGLAQRGYIKYGPRAKNLIGVQPTHSQGNGDMQFPSMDLYQDSWLEIVPETMYRDGYFVTEKTVKPLATKTPVLFVAACGYLEYLRQLGFQTFGSVIDESYDRQYRVTDRIELMLGQLQDIVSNGAESFYQACRPMLEHNQARLMEIAGRKTYDTDLLIRQHLEADGVV